MASDPAYHRSAAYPPSRAKMARLPQAVNSDSHLHSVVDGIAQGDVKGRDVYQAYEAHHRQQYQASAADSAPTSTRAIRPPSNSNPGDVALEAWASATRERTNSDPGHDGRCSIFSNGIEFNFDDTLDSTLSPSGPSSDSNNALTPAQKRRKAQNRAAQRALRDRKRQRVQMLEEQVTTLSIKTSALETQNSWLKEQLLLYSADTKVIGTRPPQNHSLQFASGLQGYPYPSDPQHGHHAPQQAYQVRNVPVDLGSRAEDRYLWPVHENSHPIAAGGPAAEMAGCAYGVAASWPPMGG